MTNLSELIESPDGSRHKRESARVERFIWLGRAAVLWERVWPRLWPASGILGAFIAAGLFDFFALVPWQVHTLILLGVLGAAGYLLWKTFQHFEEPSWYDGARRVERDSSLLYRPITEQNDRIALGEGDAFSEALWRAHIRSLLSRIGRLRVALPSPQLARRDPYALRFVVLLLLIGGFFAAGAHWKERLGLAFSLDAGSGSASATVDAWINPPAYTGLPPVYLKPGEPPGAPIRVPVNSELIMRVHRSSVSPQIAISPSHGKRPRISASDDEYAASTLLRDDEKVFVYAGGRTLGSWRIQTVPDAAPQIAFAGPITKTEHDAIKIAFTAGDDYGVVSARAIIKPLKGTNTLAIDLPIDASAKTIKQTVYRDLTENPLAGLDVTVTLEAKDGAGQIGRSRPMAFHLPARIFTNPLAKALIEQRQGLAANKPHAKPLATATLDALTIAPDKFYPDQTRLYLVLRSTYWMLRTARTPGDIQRIEDLLWQTAVSLEGNGADGAAQALRMAAEALAQAMAHGAPQSIIDALMQRYQQALQNYMQAMAKNAQAMNGPPPPGTKVITQDDIEKMLKLIQQLAASGSREAAAQMLAMLQSLLENMQMSAGGAGSGGAQDKALNDAIQGLSDLMGRQRQLMDKTYREGQDAGDPKDGGPKGLSQQQGKLRDDLNALLKGLGGKNSEAGKALGDAGRQMGEAQGALGNKDFDNAGSSEQKALDALRKGAGALAKALMEKSGQGNAQGEGSGNQDPFGRANGAQGGISGGNVKVPDKDSLARAREILKELRKRAGETGRSKEELDYLDRLLKEF